MSLRKHEQACGKDATLTWRTTLIEMGLPVSNSRQDKHLHGGHTSMRLAFVWYCTLDTIREATTRLAGLEKDQVDPVSF
jgi:hypothetical protein